MAYLLWQVKNSENDSEVKSDSEMPESDSEVKLKEDASKSL